MAAGRKASGFLFDSAELVLKQKTIVLLAIPGHILMAEAYVSHQKKNIQNPRIVKRFGKKIHLAVACDAITHCHTKHYFFFACDYHQDQNSTRISAFNR